MVSFILGANASMSDCPQNIFFTQRNNETLRRMITLVLVLHVSHRDSSYATFEDNIESIEDYVHLCI